MLRLTYQRFSRLSRTGTRLIVLTWMVGLNVMIIAVMLPTSALAFEPTMSVLVENPTRPIVHGATNLPDGSKMIVSVSRPQSSYGAQSKVVVESGQFKTEQFSQGDQDLNPGTDTIEIVMAGAEIQPSTVQNIIGARGEKMAGKLVKHGSWGPSVEYTTHFDIGKGSNKQLDVAAREQAKADTKKWEVSNCIFNVDFVNSMVRSGAVTGRETLGADRQRKIDDCIRKVSQ